MCLFQNCCLLSGLLGKGLSVPKFILRCFEKQEKKNFHAKRQKHTGCTKSYQMHAANKSE